MSFLDRLFGKVRKNPLPAASPAIGYITGGTVANSATLDELLGQIEKELKSSRTLLIRRLRWDYRLGDQVICWSFPEVQGKDLDRKAAEQILNSRLASIGFGLDGSPSWTSDDDGCTLAFWHYGHAQYSDVPPQFKHDIEVLEGLDSDRQKAEAKRLARSHRFNLLVAWLCEARHKGIPANELRESNDSTAAKLLIQLLGSPYPDIRDCAARALGPLGGEDAARALCLILPQAEGQTLEIAYALFRLPFAGSIEPLTRALRKATDFYHQVYLAKALARSGGQEGLDFLIDGLKTHAGSEHMEALLQLEDRRVIPALKSYLESLQMREVDSPRQKRLKEFLARHGVTPSPAAEAGVPAEVHTSLGFIAKESPWSVQPTVLKLREAIMNTWSVRCQVLELTKERAAAVRRDSPMEPKQWVVDGQYQIELSANSIFIHAYGSWVDLGYTLFLYQKKIYYVNVAPGTDLTQFIYSRTDDLSHMAKIAIALNIGLRDRETPLVCLEGDLLQRN
jgi:hypothetical protein